ncbi:MAG TPA: hypothetical protein VEA69_02955 [Tepidisphaeraceae bacterium]|nr:hypothetical protein [Tepidisphaeraceae bacterium]
MASQRGDKSALPPFFLGLVRKASEARFSHVAVVARALDYTGPIKTLYNMLQGRKAHWKHEYTDRYLRWLAPYVYTEPDRLWEYVETGQALPPALVDLLHLSSIRLEGRFESRLTARALELERTARCVTCISRVPTPGLMEEDLIYDYNAAIAAELGKLGTEMREQADAFGRDRRLRFLQGDGLQGERRRTVFLWTGLEELRNRRGAFGRSDVESVDDHFQSLIDDAIIHHDVPVTIVDDRPGRLPRDLLQYFEPYDTLAMFDNNVVMKIPRGSLTRYFAVRGDNVGTNLYLDRDIAMIREMCARACHTPTKSGAIDVLDHIRS